MSNTEFSKEEDAPLHGPFLPEESDGYFGTSADGLVQWFGGIKPLESAQEKGLDRPANETDVRLDYPRLERHAWEPRGMDVAEALRAIRIAHGSQQDIFDAYTEQVTDLGGAADYIIKVPVNPPYNGVELD